LRRRSWGNAVEERLQVQVQDPILSPAALPADPDRIQRRPPRPIPIGVRVEHWLHPRLKVSVHDGLGDPIRDRRHPEHPRAAVPLQYLHRAHRRGHIAPRRQPIPELVEVPLQVPLELLDRLLINAGRALVGLTLNQASQTARLEITNDFGFGSLTRLLPPESG
jgi:hypothetical protein